MSKQTEIKIKDASKGVKIGFGKSGAPLGERSQDELVQLALMAQQAGNKNLLQHFEGELPTIEELQEMATDKRLAAVTGTAVATGVNTGAGIQGAGTAPATALTQPMLDAQATPAAGAPATTATGGKNATAGNK